MPAQLSKLKGPGKSLKVKSQRKKLIWGRCYFYQQLHIVQVGEIVLYPQDNRALIYDEIRRFLLLWTNRCSWNRSTPAPLANPHISRSLGYLLLLTIGQGLRWAYTSTDTLLKMLQASHSLHWRSSFYLVSFNNAWCRMLLWTIYRWNQ